MWNQLRFPELGSSWCPNEDFPSFLQANNKKQPWYTPIFPSHFCYISSLGVDQCLIISVHPHKYTAYVFTQNPSIYPPHKPFCCETAWSPEFFMALLRLETIQRSNTVLYLQSPCQSALSMGLWYFLNLCIAHRALNYSYYTAIRCTILFFDTLPAFVCLHSSESSMYYLPG